MAKKFCQILHVAMITVAGVVSRKFAEHRERRRAPAARRDDREYREYLRKEQRRSRGAAAFECQRISGTRHPRCGGGIDEWGLWSTEIGEAVRGSHRASEEARSRGLRPSNGAATDHLCGNRTIRPVLSYFMKVPESASLY